MATRIKLHHRLIVFLFGVFICAVALRWLFLPSNLFFGFEQGRDAQIIHNIFYQHDFKLVGPKTDLNGIFHGAYYYYLLLPAYILSGGNPLAASAELVLLSSLTVLIAFGFAREFWHSSRWGAVAAILVAGSYEYIIYARWLSNVTPAIPFILLTFWLLWKSRRSEVAGKIAAQTPQTPQPLWFALAAWSAVWAAQFEIVLMLFWAWIWLWLWITRILPRPSLKNSALTVVGAGGIFAPYALYNLRNQNTVFKAILALLSHHEANQDGALSAGQFSYNAHNLLNSYVGSLARSLNVPQMWWAAVLILFIVSGLFISWMKQKNRATKQRHLFLLIALTMCVPAMFFHDVAQLVQLYLGVGLVWIFLLVEALLAWWPHFTSKQPKMKQRFCQLVVIVILLAWAVGFRQAFHGLVLNRPPFFVTIQTDLNFADQQRVLRSIHDDAAGQTYRFVAYTIPYLQPEGWQYLRSYFLLQDRTDDGAKLVYIVIEENVEPFWQKKWTEDLGSSQLISTQHFGKITVEKRQLQ